MGDRDDKGHFLPGNKCSVGNTAFSKDYYRLKRQWCAYWTDEKFAELCKEVFTIARYSKNAKDKLNAIELVCKTFLLIQPPGEVKVSIENNVGKPQLPVLSDEEVTVVEKILSRSFPAVTDVKEAIEQQ
jgi:hypothetical protein